jgi:hypothetical protein
VHLKNGAGASAEGVRFVVHMLPKLMVSGPVPEIEQAQIECFRGEERGLAHLDTLHKRARCGGLTFELGYADVYHDDIEITVLRESGGDAVPPGPAVGPAPACTPAHPDELENGVGACRVDADCELSSFQEGCCTQACEPTAKNKADLARARAGEDCAEQKKKHPSCPPPSPCPARTYQSVAAVCCEGQCKTARRRVP